MAVSIQIAKFKVPVQMHFRLAKFSACQDYQLYNILHFQMHRGHCSALIKVLPGYENIYAAHSRLVHFFKCHVHVCIVCVEIHCMY